MVVSYAFAKSMLTAIAYHLLAIGLVLAMFDGSCKTLHLFSVSE